MKKETIDIWMFVSKDTADAIAELKEKEILDKIPPDNRKGMENSREDYFRFLTATDKYLIGKMQEKLNLDNPPYLWYGYCLYHGEKKEPSMDLLTNFPDESVCIHLRISKDQVICIDENRYYFCSTKYYLEQEKLDFDKELMSINHFDYPRTSNDEVPFPFTLYDDVLAFFPVITKEMVVSIDYHFVPHPDEQDLSLVSEIAKGYAHIKELEQELERMDGPINEFYKKYNGSFEPNPSFRKGCFEGKHNSEMAIIVAKACLADKKYSGFLKNGCGNPWKVTDIYKYYLTINREGAYPDIPKSSFGSAQVKDLLKKENEKLKSELERHNELFMAKLNFNSALGKKNYLMTLPKFKNRLR